MAGRSTWAARARALRNGEAGQAAVLSVVWMVVLLGMGGLVIDLGSWYRSQRQLQQQADASALAGAQELPNDTSTASSEAIDYAKKNGYTLTPSGITFSSAVAPNDSINVKVNNNAPTFFSKLFGINTVPIKAEATAETSLMGEARYVAPITVNIKHPMLSGPGCPCFHVPTTLPLDKRGAPGAFGLLDLDNGTGNGGSTLASWISLGYDAYLGLGDYSSNTGAKFEGTDIDNALQSRLGTVLLFPVFDTIDLTGTNAIYNIIAWVGFKLDGYDTHGHVATLTGEFTDITWEGIPAAAGGPPPIDLGARTVTLVH
jgi:Flp pilus assembly protein TadG